MFADIIDRIGVIGKTPFHRKAREERAVEWERTPAEPSREANSAEDSPIFKMCLIGIAAKLAMICGGPYEDRIEAMSGVLKIKTWDKQAFREMFLSAVEDPVTVDMLARQMKMVIGGDASAAEFAVKVLLRTLCAEEMMNDKELAGIKEAAERIGLARGNIMSIVRAEMACAHKSPDEVLGLGSRAGAAEIKSAYKKLSKYCHPDVVRAGGASDELVELAAIRFISIAKAFKEAIGRLN